MTYQEAWKIVLGAVENTYEDNVKEALFLLAEAAMMDEEQEAERASQEMEMQHGRWIHHDDGVFTCSKCGNAESNDSYYCRLCGVKMDGVTGG